jgi:predicted  nucleic acid-binding Zn-ribbon protein
LSSSDGSAGGGASGGVGYISYSGGVPAGSVTSAAATEVVSSARSSEEFDDMVRRSVSVHTDAIRAELQEKFGAQLQQLQVDFEQRIHAIQVELQAQSEVQVRAEIQRIRSGVDEQLRAFGGTIQMWSKSASGVEGQIVALRGTLQKLSEASSENVAIRSELWDDVGRLLDTTEALSLTMQKTDDKMARELSPAVTKLTSAVNKLEHWRSVTHSKVSQLEHQVTMVDNRIYGLEQFFGYS